ncbi:hypothetical protein LXL04_031554 [Taraxacum kok-saghyz]
MRTISADPDEIDVFQRHVEEDEYIPTFQQEDDESSEDYDETDNVSGSVSSSSIASNSSSTTSRFVAENSHNTDVHDVKPDVPDEFIPNKLMRFRTVNDAIDMYRSYAEKAGFDVRLNTERKSGERVIHKYLVCHRNGKLPNKSVEIKNKRNTHYRSTNCKAKIVIKHIDGSTDYRFDKFEELHNHEMEDAFHLRKNRKLSFSDKEFIMRASTAKIGATKAYKLKATLKGGFEQVKGKVVDFKNFTRDMGSIIGSNDAQLIVNKLLDRKENYPNFSYYQRLDENKVLNALFWADETEKAYYNEFGDVMSFDATFRTNKYGLVFVPFTVIDHHKSSVTVGAGLLSTEDVPSYKWLLQRFLEAHGNKHPALVLTDQCPSLKQAVESMFPNSKHRLCMWHIMKKLPKKVGQEFLKTTNFKKQFKKIVWDMDMKPDMFDHKWNMLMQEHVFDLKTSSWFSGIYEIRDSWIPAYINDYPMCGMMKTTSRSESMNSFFISYSQADNFFVNFMRNYDNAISKIRFAQRELDHTTKIARYVMKTPREIEIHASKVYTNKMFLEVEFKAAEKEIKCSCDHFNRFGILCRHAFKILLNKDIKEIPERYVLRRWRKDVLSANYNLTRDQFDDRDIEVTKLVSEAYYNFESCLDLVRDDKEKLAAFVHKTTSMLKDAKSDSSGSVSNKNSDVVERFIGVPIPDKVDIQVPNVQNNKGCGKKRLVGAAENAILKAQKKTRICSGCGKREPHNLRTCPVFFPVIRSNHIYLYVFDLKNTKVVVLDNMISDAIFSKTYVHLKTLIRYFISYLQEVNHTRAYSFSRVLIPKKVFETVSMTRHNKVDCGVFAMRNMEVYKGETKQHYNSGIPVESDFQKLLLSRMRSKYLHSILLSHINLQKEQVLEKARKYAQLDPKRIENDRRLASLAIDTRLHMVALEESLKEKVD